MNKTPLGDERKARPFLMSFDGKLSARTKDDNGYMRVIDCNITKEQVVPYYGREIPNWQGLGLDYNKIYYMYRPATEIEKAAATFNGVPLAYEHHEMTADSMPKQYIIGSIGTDAKFVPPYLKASLIVTDSAAIDAIERGEYKQLSAAYLYDPVMTSGMFNGKHYDGIMTNLRGNHVALVKEGRAGADVVVTDEMDKKLKLALQAKEKERSNGLMDIVKRLKRLMAWDAVPAIEEMEVNLASLLKAVQVIEAQREGLNPRDIGLDVDKDATVDDVVNRYFGNLGKEEKQAIKLQLDQLMEAPEVDENGNEKVETETPALPEDGEIELPKKEEPTNEPEQENKPAPVVPTEQETEVKLDETKETPVKDDEAVVEEEKKTTVYPDYADAMKECGLDCNDGAQSKAFAEGVKYGESLMCNPEEREHLDRLHESEGEEKHIEAEKEKEPEQKDFKAVLDEELDKAKEEIKRNCEGLYKAANDCKSVLGIISNPFAFDSADAIYTKALEQMGISYDGVPSAARGSFFKALRQQVAPTPLTAQDTKLIQSETHLKTVFERLANIKSED